MTFWYFGPTYQSCGYVLWWFLGVYELGPCSLAAMWHLGTVERGESSDILFTDYFQVSYIRVSGNC